jgi:pseudouridine-5'-phosphate glycosidase
MAASFSIPLDLRPDVAEAIRAGRPVVALSSGPIAHSLPWPINLETAREAEAAVRAEGALPATVAVWEGRPTIGLGPDELEELAGLEVAVKASRQNLAALVATGETVTINAAVNMALASQAGIRLVVTGGSGGVGQQSEHIWDVPDDLVELSRTPVAVVSGGAKGVLNLSHTLDVLESLGVPVVGYGTDTFPALFIGKSSCRVSARVDTPEEAAKLLAAHWALGGAGVLLVQPAPTSVALDPNGLAEALVDVERHAARVRSKDLTPFLMSRLVRLTGGKALQLYRAILTANAALAARVAVALSALKS